MSAIIDRVSVRKKFVNAAVASKYQNFYRQAALARVTAAKEQLLEDFDEHQVTRELLQDPNEPGSSMISKGNLVSFLGEIDASVKVGQIRLVLEDQIKLEPVPDITVRGSTINFDFIITTPRPESLNAAAKSDWSNRSIIQIIEDGIGNAAAYIFNSLGLPGSRSGFGLQSKKKVVRSGGTFATRDWIKEILADFRSKFKLGR